MQATPPTYVHVFMLQWSTHFFFGIRLSVRLFLCKSCVYVQYTLEPLCPSSQYMYVCGLSDFVKTYGAQILACLLILVFVCLRWCAGV